MPLAVRRRPRSGSPGSASAWRQRIRSISYALEARGGLVRHAFQQFELRRGRAALRLGLGVGAVRRELPRVLAVREVGLEALVDHARLEGRVENGKRHLDPPEEITSHPVGAREIHVLGAVVVELPDAVMLEKAADDG